MTTEDHPVRFGLRVRYHECDMQGIVFNATYLAYADMASFELWRALLGSYEEVWTRGYDTTVVAAQLDFRMPLRFEDELALEVGVSRVGTTSLDLTTTILRDDERVARITVTYVFVDRETFSSKPPPDDIRELLLRHPVSV